MTQAHRHFTKRQKTLTALVIVAIVLIAAFAFLPLQNGTPLSSLEQWLTGSKPDTSPTSALGMLESSQAVNDVFWKTVAADAWAYFQPGVGVDPNTGLPYAGGADFKAFTAWDLGVYIQAVIDAQKIGLVSTDGKWGSYARLEKVLTFLETRPLNQTTGYPFWFYDATNGKDYTSLSDTAIGLVDVVDTGRLFVSLNNLKAYNPAWADQINNFVYDTYSNRSNFSALVPSLENNASSQGLYGYYFISGFAAFWPQQLGDVPNGILTNIIDSPTVNTYNVTLPHAPISCEPLLCAAFELNSSGSQLMGLVNQVYIALQAYYNTTGQYIAYSEGNSFSSNFIWEWMVPPPDGTPWEITATNNAIYNGPSILYDKVGFGFLALYNSTFARDLTIHILQKLPAPTNGFSDGADNAGQVVPGFGSNTKRPDS